MQAPLINHSPLSAERRPGLVLLLRSALQEASPHQSTSAPGMKPMFIAEETEVQTGTFRTRIPGSRHLGPVAPGCPQTIARGGRREHGAWGAGLTLLTVPRAPSLRPLQ